MVLLCRWRLSVTGQVIEIVLLVCVIKGKWTDKYYRRYIKFGSYISLWDGKDGTCLKTNANLSDLKHSGVKVCVIQEWYYMLVSLSAISKKCCRI